MRGQLVVIAGPDLSRTFVLTDGQEHMLGRGLEAAFRLADPHVSRAHCEVRLERGQAVAKDAGSASGTLVNNHRIVEHVLKEGDVIQIGGTQLRFETGVNPNASTLPLTQQPPSVRLAGLPTAFYYRHLKSDTVNGILLLTLIQPQLMDEATTEAVRVEILNAISDAGAKHVILNCDQVTDVSAEIVRPLTIVQMRVAEKGGRLMLCHLSTRVEQVLRLAGALQGANALSFQPDAAQAVKAIQK